MPPSGLERIPEIEEIWTTKPLRRCRIDGKTAWTTLYAPSAVAPRMQTWAIRRVPRPILTSGPMTQ